MSCLFGETKLLGALFVKQILRSILFLCSLSPSALCAEEATTVTLLFQENPGYIDKEEGGTYSGRFYDYTQQLSQLTNYQFTWREAPLPVRLKLMEQWRPNVCILGLVKTPEREIKYHYTHRIGTINQYVIVAKKGRPDILKHKNFESLLADKNLKTYVRESVTYGKKIDSLIAQNNIDHLTLSKARLTEMLLNGKLDYSITTTKSAEQLVDLNEEVGIYDHLISNSKQINFHIACSQKTPLHIINTLNKAIDQLPQL